MENRKIGICLTKMIIKDDLLENFILIEDFFNIEIFLERILIMKIWMLFF